MVSLSCLDTGTSRLTTLMAGYKVTPEKIGVSASLAAAQIGGLQLGERGYVEERGVGEIL